MNQIRSLAEIVNSAREGDIIPYVNGTITELYEPKVIKSQGQEKQLQNGVLSDGTAKVKFTLWSKTVPLDAKGSHVSISSTKGNKGTLVGVIYRPYKDEPQLSITSYAQIDFEGGDSGALRPETAAVSQFVGYLQDRHAKAQPVDARAELEKLAKFHLCCFAVMREQYQEILKEDNVLPAVQFGAFVSSLFIQGVSQGLHRHPLLGLGLSNEEHGDIL